MNIFYAFNVIEFIREQDSVIREKEENTKDDRSLLIQIEINPV